MECDAADAVIATRMGEDGPSPGVVKPVVLRLHGMLGNLLDETEHALPQILA